MITRRSFFARLGAAAAVAAAPTPAPTAVPCAQWAPTTAIGMNGCLYYYLCFPHDLPAGGRVTLGEHFVGEARQDIPAGHFGWVKLTGYR